MLGFLNTAITPVKTAANQFLRNQAAAAIRKAGPETYRTLRRGSDLQSELAALKLTLNIPAIQRASAGIAGLTGVDISNRTGLTGQIEGTLNKVGPKLDQLFSGTSQVVQQFGREQEKKGWGGALEVATPFGFLASPFIPNTPARTSVPSASATAGTQTTFTGVGTSATLNALNAPGVQSRFIQDSVGTSETFGTVSPPAERAYLEEKNRAIQLTEQDQLAKKYKVADLTKAYNTAASPEEKEKIGLQIWATTNPRLAARLKPGQLGYAEAQTAAQSQGPLGVINQAVGDMQYAEKIGFGIPSPTGATAFALETPLTKVPVPPTAQAGVTEAFTKVSPNVTEAFKGDVFKPDLSQTQLALLKQAFERGLK